MISKSQAAATPSDAERNPRLRDLANKKGEPVRAKPSIFVSYSAADRGAVSKLVNQLQAEGFSTFWDQDVIAGDAFMKRISDALDASSAVVVVWSAASKRSEFVKEEALRAFGDKKLVQLNVPGFNTADLPEPFKQIQSIPIDDRGALLKAFQGLNITAQEETASKKKASHQVSVAEDAMAHFDKLSRNESDAAALTELVALLSEYRIYGPVALDAYFEDGRVKIMEESKNGANLEMSLGSIVATLSLKKDDLDLVLEGLSLQQVNLSDVSRRGVAKINTSNDVTASVLHRAQHQDQSSGAISAQSIEEVLAGVVYTDERKHASLFLGVEFETRTRSFTFGPKSLVVLNPDDIPTEGTEWISVSPSTTISTLIKRFGDRLLFAAGEHKEQTLTVLMWELLSRDTRSVRVLIRKEET